MDECYVSNEWIMIDILIDANIYIYKFQANPPPQITTYAKMQTIK